mmetsp:Transcript_5217/g.10653  ORF Transcript_5217/g.10653 Transcript_5217/m.10653 type:complete len:81 (-) Transcript_5217:907-1149(-)
MTASSLPITVMDAQRDSDQAVEEAWTSKIVDRLIIEYFGDLNDKNFIDMRFLLSIKGKRLGWSGPGQNDIDHPYCICRNS